MMWGMTVPPSTDLDALAARVRDLEAENARLAAGRSRPAGSRSRAFASALCLVVAAILIPVSIVSAWARVQLVDEEAFVATLAPLVDDPAVQELLVDETMDAITAQVDFDALTASVFDGIAELGMPPRAAAALQLLQGPAADGLESLVGQTVAAVVTSDAFSDVWATTTRAAHKALTTAATSDGGGVVVRTPDGVGIQLGVVVERVKETLVDRGVAIADLIPAIDRVVIVGEGRGLDAVRAGYAIAATLGLWLPVITLVLLAAGVLLARRRSAGVIGAGLALAIGAGALAATLSIARTAVGLVAGELELSPSALDVIYGRLVDGMTQTAVVLSLVGVFVAVLGWVMGRSRAATSVRGTIRGVNAAGRAQLAARGLDTGRFGTWIGAHRVAVRVIIAVLAVLWLFSLRPLSLGDAVLVIVIAFVVAWALELLQRRPDPATDGETAGTEDAAGTAEAEDAEDAAPAGEQTDAPTTAAAGASEK